MSLVLWHDLECVGVSSYPLEPGFSLTRPVVRLRQPSPRYGRYALWALWPDDQDYAAGAHLTQANLISGGEGAQRVEWVHFPGQHLRRPTVGWWWGLGDGLGIRLPSYTTPLVGLVGPVSTVAMRDPMIPSGWSVGYEGEGPSEHLFGSKYNLYLCGLEDARALRKDWAKSWTEAIHKGLTESQDGVELRDLVYWAARARSLTNANSVERHKATDLLLRLIYLEYGATARDTIRKTIAKQTALPFGPAGQPNGPSGSTRLGAGPTSALGTPSYGNSFSFTTEELHRAHRATRSSSVPIQTPQTAPQTVPALSPVENKLPTPLKMKTPPPEKTPPALVQYLRTEKELFYLTPAELPTDLPPRPPASHHIFVVDRSGSMAGDMEALKRSLIQVLSVMSITGTDVLTSLISFSSHGDVKVHWIRARPAEIQNLKNPYLKEVEGLRATALTGISQGLQKALSMAVSGEATGITLFTDGYANSPSPYVENQALEAFAASAAKFQGLFLNCVGYRDWCDWPRLQALSNRLSGRTIKATTFTQVLDAMKESHETLIAGVQPTVSIRCGTGEFVVGINRTSGQVNASAPGEPLVLNGIRQGTEPIEVYRVRRGSAFEKPPRNTRVVPVASAYLYGALAEAMLNCGEIRTAKELLFSSGNKTLWERHLGAMSPSSLADLSADLGAWVKQGGNGAYFMGRNMRPKHNLFDLIEALNTLPPRSVGLNVKSFLAEYKRRSIQDVVGSRQPDGKLLPPRADLKPKDGARLYVTGCSLNSGSASVQLETRTAAQLYPAGRDQPLNEIECISLEDLAIYRSYTLISGGERNVETIPLFVYTKQAWEALNPFLTPGRARAVFSAGQQVDIELRRFGVDGQTLTPEKVLGEVLSKFTAVAETKLFDAIVDKGKASPYTTEQVAALAECHLTPSLYFSPPTTVPYTDRDAAITAGLLDSYTRYKVNLGTTQILSTDDFRSGNEFLRYRYTVTSVDLDGKVEVQPKPTLAGFFKGDQYKINGKACTTPADLWMAQRFDRVLVDARDLHTEDVCQRRLALAKKQREVAEKTLSPLILEIGCTGLLPPELEAAAARFEADAFAAKYGRKLGKNEKEGVYYVLPVPESDHALVISVIPETMWYTTKAGERRDGEL